MNTVYASSSRPLQAQCAAKVVVDVSSVILEGEECFIYGACFEYASRVRRGGFRGGTRFLPKFCGFHSLPQCIFEYDGDAIYIDR